MTGCRAIILIVVVRALCFGSACFAAPAQFFNGGSGPILIISSYNPDSYSTSTNITEFIEEYDRLGGTATVHIENMNCRSFSESLRWRSRMRDILNKYHGASRPGCVILLGQEAWASYLSLDESTTSGIPVFSVMASRNAVILPDGSIPLRDWMPESVDFVSGSSGIHIQGGFLYEYDVESNVNLIRKLYPDTRNIAFVSDNTYGGVSIQAFVRKEMEKFPDMTLTLLDGRKHTIYTIVEALRGLPSNTALLLGTWRVDENDGYFMQNATYSMMEAVPAMPVFSLTSLGLGYWALGGRIPEYRNFGKDVAQQVVNVMFNDSTANTPTIVSNRLHIDSKKLAEMNIDRSLLPAEVRLINVEPTFYQEYKPQILAVALIVTVLSLALALTFMSFTRTKRIKDNLIVSEAALRIAKEKAEESNRLKSAFLANMSHEIRTPLNAIVGFSNILATREAPSLKTRTTCYENIKNSSSLLLRLINDILDLSKLEAEKIIFTYRDCDIVPLLRQVIATMEHSAKSTNIFVFNPIRESFILNTDEQRLQQVLINLLSNASKFTKNGTIMLDFDIDRSAGCVLFSVTDTGSGIPAEKHETVFSRFEKLNTFTQGTGLGLSICKLTTAKWGGDIWIDPGYTNGTRFVFSHPLSISPLPDK